jgi:hypothetical protein
MTGLSESNAQRKPDGGPRKENVVIVPCPPEQFAQFISSLLGTPQVIQNSPEGSFDVKFSDIESIFHPLTHRLAEQNEAQLLLFTATFSFSGRSSVEIVGFENIKQYTSVKSVETVRLSLSFEYLVRFTNRSIPEKQIVDITFIRRDNRLYFEDDTFFPLPPSNGVGRIVIRVKHTARSWGSDIEALLSEFLGGFLRTETRIKFISRRFSSWIWFRCGAIILIGGLIPTAPVLY